MSNMFRIEEENALLLENARSLCPDFSTFDSIWHLDNKQLVHATRPVSKRVGKLATSTEGPTHWAYSGRGRGAYIGDTTGGVGNIHD